MLKGFKQFVMRGNVIDLAIAVVIGLAFNAAIQALVRDMLLTVRREICPCQEKRSRHGFSERAGAVC